MISPERKWPGTTIDITGNFSDADGFLVDPDTVALRIMSPEGIQTSYLYPGTISRNTQGVYTASVVPDRGGVWHYRWETASGSYALTPEGDFVVQVSPFIDGRRDAYRT